MSYRNPAVEALEYEVRRLRAKLETYKTFYPNLDVGPTTEYPNATKISVDQMTFHKLASAEYQAIPDQGQYHFTSVVKTPPNSLRVNYYVDEVKWIDRKSAYDIIEILQENLMKKFYDELKRKHRRANVL